jgi:GNAT superfamily N-acetyltransferase
MPHSDPVIFEVEPFQVASTWPVMRLVTDEAMRSRGLGKALLDWLRHEAWSLGCGQLHLDSGLHRVDAHRFYERESLKKTAFHFAVTTGQT